MANSRFLAHMRKAMNGQSRRSLHTAFVAGIQSAIAGKLLHPGVMLPSERDLSAQLDLSRNVIRRAISTLEAGAILSTRHGYGTFVPKDLRKSTNSALGFTEEMTRRGVKVGNRVLRNIVRRPTSSEAMEIGLNPDDEIREIIRVRSADGVAISLEIALVPSWAVAGNFDGLQSLYAAMEAKGTRPIRVLQEISACAASSEVVENLTVGSGSPTLKITRKGFDSSNNVVEFTTSYFPSDRYTWITELRR